MQMIDISVCTASEKPVTPVSKALAILEQERRKERYVLKYKQLVPRTNDLEPSWPAFLASQMYLVIQHHDEDKKQIYHSAQNKRNWPT
jgi:hypothetical protein